MKVLHIGGVAALTRAFARYQERSGHSVTVVAPETCALFSQRDAIPEVLNQLRSLASHHFDIIHIHRLDALNGERAAVNECENILKEYATRGAKIYLSLYGYTELSDRQALENVQRILSHCIDHVFISSADNLPFIDNFRRWSWLPMGVDLSAVSPPQPTECVGRPVKILYAPVGAAPGERDFVHQTIESLKNLSFRFEYAVFDDAAHSDLRELRSAIQAADLVIERVDTVSYGLVAIDSMVHGRTVLSGNSRDSHDVWEQMAMCPVLDATGQNLLRRLESILREPRCLRDLSKRSRAFGIHHHNLEAIVARCIAHYLSHDSAKQSAQSAELIH